MDTNNGNGNMPYQNWNDYNNSMVTQQPEHGVVRDVFCNLLLGVFMLQLVVGMFMVHGMFSAMDYDSLMDGSYIYNLTSGSYVTCSMISMLLMIAMIIFLVLDIVSISKAGYKILGLVLFAIFLRPGYYIWRAYVLERKKAFPIVYTVAYTLFYLGYIVFTVVEVMQMVAMTVGM